MDPILKEIIGNVNTIKGHSKPSYNVDSLYNEVYSFNYNEEYNENNANNDEDYLEVH